MKRKRCKSSRLLAVLLAGVLLIGALPWSALAETETSAETDAYYSLQELPENVSSILNLTETEQLLRTNNLCEFRIEDEDGSGRVELYTSPVKYVDSAGTVQLIDTSMTLASWLKRAFSGYAYRNAANRFTAEYGAKASFGLRMDEAFILTPASESEGESAVVGTAYSPNDTVRYDGAFGNGTVWRQTNTTTGVQQQIRVPDRQTGLQLAYTFDSEKYYPVLRNNGGAVDIVDRAADEVAYTISAIYLSDSFTGSVGSSDTADGARHFDDQGSAYRLEVAENGDRTIFLSLSDEFLSDENTVYPVTAELYVMPHVLVEPGESTYTGTVEDTFISETSYAGMYSDAVNLRFGTMEGIRHRSLIRFPEFPSNVIDARDIVRAKLKLTFRDNQINCYTGKILGSWQRWSPETVTWENQPTYYNLNSTSDHHNMQYYEFDITEITHDWYKSSLPNYGLMFTYADETIDDYNSVYSSDVGIAAYCPVFTYEYSKSRYSAETEAMAGSYYLIRNVKSKLYLSANNPDHVQQRKLGEVGLEYQTWKMISVGGGYYSLAPMGAENRRLDVDNAGDYDGCFLKTWVSNGNNAQKFRILKYEDGYYRLMPKISMKRVVDVYNGSENSGAVIHLWEYVGQPQQKWEFIRLDNQNLYSTMDRLVEYAKEYAGDGKEITDYYEYALQYIRSHTGYQGEMWTVVAGSIDFDFVDFVNEKNPWLSGRLNEFQSYYFDSSVPVYIDFYHMCATMEALFHPFNVFPTGRNLAGWAGDLQTMVGDVENELQRRGLEANYNNVYNITWNLLVNDESAHFSMADLYADTDAYNIYNMLKTKTYTSFSSCFTSYYSTAYSNRFLLFTNDWSKEEISECVDHYLSYALVLYDYEWLDTEERLGIGDAFTNFLWQKIEIERAGEGN